MNRKTQTFSKLFLALGLGATISFGSCSDNDIQSGGGNNDGDNSEQTELIDKHDALTRLLGALADVDSLPDAWSTYTVEPSVGIVNDAAEPHVRYLVVPNVNEAYRTYCSYIGASSTGEARNHEWKVDSIGSLKFEVKNQADLYATLKVNVQQLPTLEELRFVPSSAIGDNGIKPAGIYYRFGDIVKQTVNGNLVTYYVCVRPCSMMSELRKTHWATLQTNGSNFKEMNDYPNFSLPTKLCSKQDEGARMVQNFFNVMRIAEDPSLYDPKHNIGFEIDKIPVDEFSAEQAQILHNLWELQGDVWEKMIPYPVGYPENIRTKLKEINSLTAFYYGYSSVWWPGKGDYRVYQLDLKSSSNQFGLFDKTEASTPWIKKRTENDGHKTNFKLLQSNYTTDGIYIDSYGTDRLENSFVVKTQTGAELLGKSGIDPDPGYSFVGQSTKNDIQIEDVFTYEKARIMPLFTLGDVVDGSIYYSDRQICFLNTFDCRDQKFSYFLCHDCAYSPGAAEVFTAITSSELAKRILYIFHVAYKYAAKKEEYKVTFENTSIHKFDKQGQESVNEALANLYNEYLKGYIYANDLEGSITANLNGQCWKLMPNGETYEAVKVKNEMNLEQLQIVRYNEEKAPYETFSKDNKKISYGIKGFARRWAIDKFLSDKLFGLFEWWDEKDMVIPTKQTN